jgi:4a-hydroxytetrahydrobiopterin dehydratase
MSAALAARQCAPQATALDAAAIARLLPQVAGWHIADGKLGKTFDFLDYYQTLAFVNALAYMTHTQDHHPELTVRYNSCSVLYETHSAHGLTENDFICAAKADALYQGRAGRA